MKGQGPKSARILLGYAGWGPGDLVNLRVRYRGTVGLL